MAVLNFNITVPDAQRPRILAALQKYYTTPPRGDGVMPTQAEVLERVRLQVRATILNMVRDAEKITAAEQAEQTAGPVVIT